MTMDLRVGSVTIKVSKTPESDVACTLDVPEDKKAGAASQSSYKADYALPTFESGPGRSTFDKNKVVEGLQCGKIAEGPREGENMWPSNRQKVCELATAEFNKELRDKTVSHTALDCDVRVKEYSLGLTADKRRMEIRDPQVTVECKEKK